MPAPQPNSRPASRALYVVVPTHTTRHLRRTLLGITHQSRMPDRVVVSCDNDDPALHDLVRVCVNEFRFPITLVQRPYAGIARAGQVRNNAVRALTQIPESAADPNALVVFFDGDIIPAHDCLATHERLTAQPGTFVIGFRIDLTPEQTEQIDESAIRSGHDAAKPTSDQLALLKKRAARYTRQLWLRRLHLGKPHKPKLLSANFSVRLSDYLSINGFDERFEGYGQEDDDLGRRLYQHRLRPVLGIQHCRAFHQYHPTRAPGDWHASPLVRMLHAPAPTRCVLGLDNPREQTAPRTVHLFPQ